MAGSDFRVCLYELATKGNVFELARIFATYHAISLGDNTAIPAKEQIYDERP